MGLFRKSDAEPLGVTMAGVKLGQRLLAVGTRDPQLVAALAVKSGLTGRACLVDPDATQLAEGTKAIEKEGGLVEPICAPYGMWPLDAESFDVAVIPHTLAVTTLGAKQPRDQINVEVDVLAKYVERLLVASGSESRGPDLPAPSAGNQREGTS